MTRFDKLMCELCPDGVEYCNLIDFLAIKNGGDYKHFGVGSYPVYGSGGIMAYIDHYAYNKPSVLIPRKGSIDKLYYVEEPFWNVDTIFYTDINTEKAVPKYVYYCLQSEHLEQYNTAGGVPSLTQKVLNKIRIPLPPIEVQREIVRILDDFAEQTERLKAELTAELTARKKQYEYYRDKLLDRPHDSAKIITIGELGAWSGGKTPSMDNLDYWEDGTIPWITSKDMKVPTLEDTADHITKQAISEASMTVYPPNGIAVVTRSGILKHTLPVAFVPFETTVNQDIKMLVAGEGVLPRYAFHAIQGKSPDILAKTKKQGGTVDSLEFKRFLDYKIPLPSLEVQKSLIEVLDNFDAICSDLNIGLPAEIEARQKQYEYYRDMLLTFAESGSTILTDRQNIIKLIQYVFGYAWLSLDEISTSFRGEYITKKDSRTGNIPVILGGQEPAYYIDKANHAGEIVVVARSGASAGFVSYWNEPVFITDGFGYENNPSLVTAKYLFYSLKNRETELNAMKRGAGVPHISGGALAEIQFAIPNLQEQQRIVSILDRFDTLCNDLTAGLPAEIEARQKQYEYYRDKLLTFKERIST